MNRIDIVFMKIDQKDRFGLIFRYERVLTQLVRSIPGARWSYGHNCWHMAMTQANLNRVIKTAGKVATVNLQRISDGFHGGGQNKLQVLGPLLPGDSENLKKLREFMQFRRYSHSTSKIYLQILGTYFRFRDPDAEEACLQDEVIRFTNEYIRAKHLSYSYQNQFINALKLFYKEVLKKIPELETLRRPRCEYRLPNVLSKEEVVSILKVMRNIKHRAMLSLIYACGLRRGELLALKPEHVDSQRHLLIVKMAKGNKDRIVPLSLKLIELLRDYYREYRPKVYLFEGVVPGEKYDERSLQMVLKKAIYLSGIKKKVTLHWLRHSYATHLHESGVDIHLIQLLLGHKNTKTTEIYTHVSQKSIQLIRSPFDDL